MIFGLCHFIFSWQIDPQLQAAQQAIATAEKADAGRHAAVELGEARTKLAAADAAVREEKMDAAARMADESRVAAELAGALRVHCVGKAVAHLPHELRNIA